MKEKALARIPESLDAAEAAPLMCAGITTSIGRGPGNAALAKKLGADLYIDSVAADAAAQLQQLDGARVILATAPSGKSMSALVGGLGANGTLIVAGASMDPIVVLLIS